MPSGCDPPCCAEPGQTAGSTLRRRAAGARTAGTMRRMDLIPKPDQVVSAAGNVAHTLLYGGLADLRPMPRTLIDDGELREVYHYRPAATAREQGDPVLLVTPLAAPALCFDLRQHRDGQRPQVERVLADLADDHEDEDGVDHVHVDVHAGSVPPGTPAERRPVGGSPGWRVPQPVG